MISRRRLHPIVALLLPLLALRVLLPAGYMLPAVQDGPRIVLCSDGLAAWNTPADDSRHPQPPAGGEDCPFAHAAFNAPPPHCVAGMVPAPQIRFLARTADQRPPSTGPPRQTSARAPPFIS